MWNWFLEEALQVYQVAVADQILNWIMKHEAWIVVLNLE